MSPAEYAAEGAGVRIDYGIADTPFGPMLCGQTARGVCHLAFTAQPTRALAATELRAAWPEAELHWNPAAARGAGRAAVALIRGGGNSQISVHVRGLTFSCRCGVRCSNWRRPRAAAMGNWRAGSATLRAARRRSASAVGANPVAWLIPCHRVLRAGGVLGEYHWGPERKRTMLAWEQLQAARSASEASAA